MRALFPFFVCMALAATSGAVAAASLTEGCAMALGACSVCHQVTPDQKRPSPTFDNVELAGVPAPDFGTIARKYATKPSELRKRILEARHPMPEMDWDGQDLDNVIAYIRSSRNIWRTPHQDGR